MIVKIQEANLLGRVSLTVCASSMLRLSTRWSTYSHSTMTRVSGLPADDELSLYSADSHVNTFWAEMAKKNFKKTFVGGMRFPHLAHRITTLSVIPHSNADSERTRLLYVQQDWHWCSITAWQRHPSFSSFMQNQHGWAVICWNRKSATWNYVKDYYW